MKGDLCSARRPQYQFPNCPTPSIASLCLLRPSVEHALCLSIFNNQVSDYCSDSFGTILLSSRTPPRSSSTTTYKAPYSRSQKVVLQFYLSNEIQSIKNSTPLLYSRSSPSRLASDFSIRVRTHAISNSFLGSSLTLYSFSTSFPLGRLHHKSHNLYDSIRSVR